MSEPEPAWRSTLHVALLVPGADQDAEPGVLAVPEGDGWTLPKVVVPDRIWFPDYPPILAAVREQLGLDTIVLGRAAGRLDRERREVEGLYLLEPRSGDWTSLGGRVVDRAALADVRLDPPGWSAALTEGYAALRWEAPSPDPAPWTRRGWFAMASAWIHDQLDRMGSSVVGPIEQLAHSGISSVLRVPTSDGAVFFKAIPPAGEILFANEPVLIAALAARFPNHVPTPLAIDAERRWLLLADVGPALATRREVEVWEEAVRVAARLQIATVGEVEAMLASGCHDRRLETLPDRIAPLLADPFCVEAVGEADVIRLRALAPRIRAACQELAAVGLPPTLAHGDLHAENIAVREGRFTIFDWTDACIAHPFIDAMILPEQTDNRFNMPGASERLREAYLGEWTGFAPIERLREAYVLAEPVVALHNAISYRHIVAGVEPVARLEVIGGLRWSLGTLLARLTAPDAEAR